MKIGKAFCLFLLACGAAGAQPVQPAEGTRVERLAALGKLWGAVRLVHPQLAYQDIDWDEALVQTIPKVEAAKTTEEYRAAVESMLALLHDPDTRTVVADAPAGRSGTPIAPTLQWTDDKIAIVNLPDRGYFDSDTTNGSNALKKLLTEARTGRGVVLDLRNASGVARSRIFDAVLTQSLPLLISQGFTTSGVRYRMHSGFETQSGVSSGGYFSAMVTRNGDSIAPSAPSSGKVPIVILMDAYSASLFPVFAGLQAGGIASVLQAGTSDVADGLTTRMMLGEISADIRMGELINGDGSLGFQPDGSVPPRQPGASDAGTATALQTLRSGAMVRKPRTPAPQSVPRPENFSRDTPYPDREHRLLGLFRFWNTINYFFPYKHLMDRPWEPVLAEYIPRIEAAGTALEYHLTVSEMAVNLQDSHVSAFSKTLQDYVGPETPTVSVRIVENQVVVTRIWGKAAQEAPTLKVGDIVTAVDGEPVPKRRERMSRYLAHSTPQGLIYKLNRSFLSGPTGSKAMLEIKNRDGAKSTVTLSRAPMGGGAPDDSPTYKVLKQGYGYFDLTRLTPAELDAAFEAVKNTPALILDMRGYPRGVFFALGQRLARKTATAALFERAEVSGADFSDDGAGSRRKFSQVIQPGEKPYTGKVVMLINEDAISQSEHTCLFVEAATDSHVTFIGTATNGANGDVTSVGLTGGVFVRFTGHDVRHGDGRQLQRVGIQPHIKVAPTIAGIRAGKDEVLDKAIEYLRSAKTQAR